jgi:signal transduction histidine kinase
MSAGLISRTDLFLRLVMAFFWAGGVIFAVSSEGTALEVGYLLGLLAVFALLNVVGVRPQTSPRIIHLILGFETAILIAGAVVFPEINILFVPISILAIMRLSIQRGMMWTGLLAVVNVGVQFYEAGFPDGVVDSLINAFVLFALAAFASSLLEANRARHETQRLVGELEVANEQLRQHAVQVEELAVADERHRISRGSARYAGASSHRVDSAA